MKDTHASKKFNSEFIRISRETNVESCPGLYLEGWMKDAGFQGVHAEKFVLPVGTWPKDRHLVSTCGPHPPFSLFSQATRAHRVSSLTLALREKKTERSRRLELSPDHAGPRSFHLRPIHPLPWVLQGRGRGHLRQHQEGDQGPEVAQHVPPTRRLRSETGVCNGDVVEPGASTRKSTLLGKAKEAFLHSVHAFMTVPTMQRP